MRRTVIRGLYFVTLICFLVTPTFSQAGRVFDYQDKSMLLESNGPLALHLDFGAEDFEEVKAGEDIVFELSHDAFLDKGEEQIGASGEKNLSVRVLAGTNKTKVKRDYDIDDSHHRNGFRFGVGVGFQL